ncbi:MAG: tetratricopeptide repeat protein [Spirochaetota bacterium]|jgi:tetratricopeptide (TPR) repeat protein|nr:tetratricopeptide repeat protein [Spirochaetota bacterium]
MATDDIFSIFFRQLQKYGIITDQEEKDLQFAVLQAEQESMNRFQAAEEGRLAEIQLKKSLDKAPAISLLRQIISAHTDTPEYTQAFNDMNAAIEIDPYNDAAYNKRGNIYFRQGNFDKALADFSKAIAMKPSAAAYTNRASLYLYTNEKNTDLVQQDIQRALRCNGKYVPALCVQSRLHLLKKNYQRTIGSANKAIKLDHACAPAYNDRGLANLITGNIQQGIDDLNKAIGLNPDYAEPNYNLGEYCYENEEIEKALDYIHTAIQIDPKYADAHILRAQLFKVKEYYDEAMASWEQAVSEDTRHIDGCCRFLQDLIWCINPEQILRFYQRLIARVPESPLVYCERAGINLNKIGDYKAAQADFYKAAQLDPKYADAHYGLARIYIHNKEYVRTLKSFSTAAESKPEKALKNCWQLISLLPNEKNDIKIKLLDIVIKYNPDNPDSAEAYIRLSQIYEDMSEDAHTEEDFRTAITKDPVYTPLYTDLVLEFARNGDNIKAGKFFDLAVELAPKHQGAYESRGDWQHNTNKNYAAAIENYKKHIKLSPSANGYTRLGVSYYVKKSYTRAARCFREAIRLDPHYWRAQGNLARAVADMYKKKNKFKKADDAYTKAIDFMRSEESTKKDTLYAEICNHRGIGRFDNGLYDLAGDDFEEAMKWYRPTVAAPHINRGNVYMIKGDFDSAMACYNTAEEIDPKFTHTYPNRSGLYILLGEYDKAAQDARTALALDPEFAAALFCLSLAHLLKEEFGIAEQVAQKAIKDDPKFALAYACLSAVRFRRGACVPALKDGYKAIKLDQSLELFVYTFACIGCDKTPRRIFKRLQKMLKSDPDNPFVNLCLSLSHFSNGKNDTAIKHITKTIEMPCGMEPMIPVMYDYRGDLNFEAGKYTEAIDDYTTAINAMGDAPESAQTRYGRAWAYMKIGKRKPAEADYAKALGLDPSLQDKENPLDTADAAPSHIADISVKKIRMAKSIAKKMLPLLQNAA